LFVVDYDADDDVEKSEDDDRTNAVVAYGITMRNIQEKRRILALKLT
jgi:hypothetical protein